MNQMILNNADVHYLYKFSIVVAVYNVELFIAEAIDSIIQQDIGFEENVQLILVDDGSIDKSGDICDKYQKKYPQNIIVIHKENSGVSDTRNVGLNHIKGEYVNFLDGDDKLSSNTLSEVYRYFKQWDKEVNLITIPLVFFEGKTGEHILNNKFDKGARVIYVKQEYSFPLLTMSASFVKHAIIKKYLFDNRLVTAEDAKMVLQILLEKMSFGVVPNVRYWYRRRITGQSSAIQNSQHTREWYENYLIYFALDLCENCEKINGYIPKFVQYTIMYDLQWRFQMETLPLGVLDEEGIKQYKENLRKVLSYIDDDVILDQKQIFIEHKLFILKFKYNQKPSIEYQKNDILYYYKNSNILFLSKVLTNIEFIQIYDNYLYIEGLMMTIDLQDEDNYAILAKVNDVFYPCNKIERNMSTRILGEKASLGIGFKLEIPLEIAHEYKIKFYFKINGVLIEKKVLKFKKFAPLKNEIWNSYLVANNFILTYQDNMLHIVPYSLKAHLHREISFLKGLILKKEVVAYKAFILRILFHLRKIFPQRDIWLISDRIDKADDNGEVLFHYLQLNKQRGVKTVYAISDKCDDYKRMKKIGPTIKFGGWRYKWLYLCGAKIISSQGEDYVYRPFGAGTIYYSDIIHESRFVFLQHGVIKDDLSRWLNRYAKNIHMFVTTTKPEWQSVLNYNYYYTEKEVKLTGLPRHDLLYHNEQKIITIIPTWRAYLVGEINILTGERKTVDWFEKSSFYNMYMKLLNNEHLMKRAKELGYKIRFLNHPSMEHTSKLFHFHPDVEMKSSREERYRKIFAETDLLITDYSSVAFDFAYLRKPTLYFQADENEFFSGIHTYDKGYFDYKKDGFGEVEYTAEEMAVRIIEYMEQNCQLKRMYRERIDKTFPFHDSNNCMRVCEAIKMLNKK